MGKLKQGASKKAQLAMYPIKYDNNRRRRLERHLKKHPNDIASKKALGSIHYRRKKPQHKIWSAAKIEWAHQLRLMGFNGHAALKLGERRALDAKDFTKKG